MDERFYLTNELTERSLSEKTNEIYVHIWKINDNFENEHKIIFLDDYKRNYDEMGRIQTINGRNEKKA